MSLVQQRISAALVNAPVVSSNAGGTLHYPANGVSTILVVAWRSHCEWWQTSASLAVKATSHSKISVPP